jgi:hypothetical protein
VLEQLATIRGTSVEALGTELVRNFDALFAARAP